MSKDDILRFLAKQVAGGWGTTMNYFAVLRWPNGMVDSLVNDKILIETQPSDSVICTHCGINCELFAELERTMDGRAIWRYYCNQHRRWLSFDSKEFRCWEISVQRLSDFGYETSDPDEYISFDDAASIIGNKKSTISKWVQKGRIKDNGRMGRFRKLRKSSVLLVKNKIDEKMLLEEAKELRRDSARICNF